jgi:hypothetical protein
VLVARTRSNAMVGYVVDSDDDDDDDMPLRPPPVYANPVPVPRKDRRGPVGQHAAAGGGADAARKRSKTTASSLERIGVEYEEYYDDAAIIEALKVLSTSQAARAKRVRELEQHVQQHPQAKEGADDPQRLLLKRLRRVEGCQRWFEDLERLSHAPNEHGHRRRTVSYGRKRLTVAGCLWGRRYPICASKIMLPTYRTPRSVALQGAPREVRRQICKSIYCDVDMVNSFIRIAMAKAKTYGMDPPLKTLALYGSDDGVREEMLQQIMTHHQIYERDDAKRLPLQLLHGGSYKGWLKETRPPVWTLLPWVTAFSNDVGRLLAAMLEQTDGVEAAIAREKGVIVREKKRKPYNLSGGIPEADRTIFASIMQSYEDELLDIVVDAFRREGWTVGSLQFDGLYVEPREGIDLEDTMRFAEKEVSRRTRGEFDVSLKCKELYGESSSAALDEWATAHLAHVGV